MIMFYFSGTGNSKYIAEMFCRNMNYSSSTTYFATFEVESGDRMELKVSDKEYGMLAEGDIGKLTFQGTRYKSFERNREI